MNVRRTTLKASATRTPSAQRCASSTTQECGKRQAHRSAKATTYPTYPCSMQCVSNPTTTKIPRPNTKIDPERINLETKLRTVKQARRTKATHNVQLRSANATRECEVQRRNASVMCGREASARRANAQRKSANSNAKCKCKHANANRKRATRETQTQTYKCEGQRQPAIVKCRRNGQMGNANTNAKAAFKFEKQGRHTQFGAQHENSSIHKCM